MLVRQHEREVEELDVELGFREVITSSGAVMTLPAATADLTDWVADRRKFLPVQYDDWMQVIADFHDSLATTGPKLTSVVAATTAHVEALLRDLFKSDIAADGSCTYTIDAAKRADIRAHLEQLATELSTEAAIVAAWRDLVTSVERLNRTVDEVSFRRDTLFAVAQSRNLDVVGSFGLFASLREVLTDNADAVQRELDGEAGVDHIPVFPPTWEPTGIPVWRRLQLCERILTREPYRGDCIVWLRLAPTSLPQHEVTHGQVTFYNASCLSGCVGHPEFADNFQTPPTELLSPVSPEHAPILRDGEVEWENDWNMTYARVVLPEIEVHTAERKARVLVEALKSVNHATKDTWQLLNGSILFVDGERRSRFSWGPKHDIPDRYYPENDWMGRDVERMSRFDRPLDVGSMQDLQQALELSTALKAAADEGPQAIVMTAVRALEHANVWTTGGVKNWADFVSSYLKKDQARIRLVEFISYFTRAAIDNVPDRRPGAPAQNELFEIRSRLERFRWPHQVFHARGAADEVSALHRIYAGHWLARGLGELETTLATPAGMYARLEEQGRRFDRQLKRLKRLRNSAIHGGPVSDAACESVATFAFNLGHQCLNEVMRALLTGRDIPSHMADYRADRIERFERIRTAGDVDALFVASEYDENPAPGEQEVGE
ncbi:hypothetical protein [Mycolicibacter sinensis]|uniref:hypothetical protein n=1 Tax=Mycolicibacter sinensis (strain JDM601) TaxID=875328 RepID=UPI0008001E4D|nr:hypothetical protein [Mycolicibacter sinensis]OBH19936.1 hypothetical protein A5694_01150 [Mycolicibacter sinensis]